MGRRGPPANPRSIRYQDRHKKPRETMASIPADQLGTAVMPKWLDGRAKEFWKKHAPALKARGVLTALDEALFTALCVANAHMREASEILKREGDVIFGPRGKPRLHPAVRIHANACRQFLSGLREFGMTPLSRQRLVVSPPRSDTPADDEKRRKMRELLGPKLVP